MEQEEGLLLERFSINWNESQEVSLLTFTFKGTQIDWEPYRNLCSNLEGVGEISTLKTGTGTSSQLVLSTRGIPSTLLLAALGDLAGAMSNKE